MPVYIIRAGDTDMVKIGWTQGRPEVRRRSLQGAHFLPLSVIRSIDAPRCVESWFHRYFRAHRIANEWFRHVGA